VPRDQQLQVVEIRWRRLVALPSARVTTLSAMNQHSLPGASG
jgi:hypothetical protein